MPVSVQILRGTDRFTTRSKGRETRHAFSFGEHYDPERLGVGPLVCHDDHLLKGGEGFETHPHRDQVVVTWVVSGALEHHDDVTGTRVVEAGSLAVLHAGDGVEHREVAVAGAGPTRFVQCWLVPDTPGGAPSYAVRTPSLEPGHVLDPLAEPLADPLADPAGPGGSAVDLGVAGASLRLARLDGGQTLTLPAAPLLHAFVVRGALIRSSLAEPVQAGDAFVFEDEPAYEVTAAVSTDLMVWSLPRRTGAPAAG